MPKKERGLSPTEVQNKLLDDLEERGMARTKKWVAMWQTGLRYFFGDQLHNKRTHKDWDWVILNYIWPSAIQEISKLAKHHPKILTEPWETSDAEFAEAWQGILQWLWQKGINGKGMRLEQIAAILDGKLFGYRISKLYWEDKVSWDDKEQTWMGDVKHRLWHPANFWADGIEKIDDGNCGTVRYVTLDYAQNRWPKFKKQLEEEAKSYKELTAGGDHIRGQLSQAGTYPSAGTGGIDKGAGAADVNQILNLILENENQDWDEKTKLVKISEIYYRDYKEVDEKQEEAIPPEELVATGEIYADEGFFYDAKTNKPMSQDKWPKRVIREWKRPLYPNGRHVIRVNKTILNPDNQVYPYPRWPFIVVPHYLLPHMWQGTDGVQLYKSTQDMINVTVSHLTNNMKTFGDPKIAIETGALASPPGRKKRHFKIGSVAGSVIRLARGGLQKMKIIDPISPSASALQLYGLFTQEFKNILGLQDIAVGKQADKTITATEAQYLMLSANDRIALQSVYEDEWVKEVASLMSQICQRHYDQGRIVRIIGEDNLTGVTQITQQAKTVRFDVDIIPGATLPFDPEKRIAKFKMAYEMFMSPVPNVMMPEMLRELEIPNWQKILQRYEPWTLFMQFLQLVNSVKEGQVTPEQAIQILIQKAREHIQGQQNAPEMIEARNKEKEQLDRGREQILRKGEQKGRQEEKDRQQVKDQARKNAEGNKST